ncbi:hypothetical protein ACJQWK_03482 [Exserohilum turcicum]
MRLSPATHDGKSDDADGPFGGSASSAGLVVQAREGVAVSASVQSAAEAEAEAEAGGQKGRRGAAVQFQHEI